MSTLPTFDSGLPEWATDENDVAIAEPTSGQKGSGFQDGERPDAATLNWLHWLTYLWINFLDAVVRGVRVWGVELWGFTNTYVEENSWFQIAGTLTAAPAIPTAAMPMRFFKVTGAIGVDEAAMTSTPFHYFSSTTTDAFVEWTELVTSYGASTDYEIEVGLTFASSTGVHRIVVRKTEASANWILWIEDASGQTAVDTLVPATANTPYRFRLEYSGPDGDGTDARVRLYINGVIPTGGTVTDVNVPKASPGMLWIRHANDDNAHTIGDLCVGPISWSAEVVA